MWNKVEYGLLLFFCTMLTYYVAIYIEKNQFNKRYKKYWLWLGISLNVLLLIYFKYTNFIGSTIGDILSYTSFSYEWVWQQIILPVGISFFTFQAISYLVDVYRKEIYAEKDFLIFALFLSFFPQLVAGPIERAKKLLPQFLTKKELSIGAIIVSVKIVLFGLYKKMVVADNLSVYVDKVFDVYYQATGLEYIIGIYAFMFQLYGDFSGYSDMAAGLAGILGFSLMQNFNRPFFAASIQEYWQRWHISLSSWVRDYIYIPLGGNKNGQANTIRNRFLSMLIMGLWHGANATMVIFGFLNGILTVITTTKNFSLKNKWNKAVAIFITFHLVCIPFIYFRSISIAQGNRIIKTIGSDCINFVKLLYLPDSLPIVGSFFAAILLLSEVIKEYKLFSKIQESTLVHVSYYSFVLFSILLFGVFKASQFIYFQF